MPACMHVAHNLHQDPSIVTHPLATHQPQLFPSPFTLVRVQYGDIWVFEKDVQQNGWDDEGHGHGHH